MSSNNDFWVESRDDGTFYVQFPSTGKGILLQPHSLTASDLISLLSLSRSALAAQPVAPGGHEACALICEQKANALLSGKRTNQVDGHTAGVLMRAAAEMRAIQSDRQHYATSDPEGHQQAIADHEASKPVQAEAPSECDLTPADLVVGGNYNWKHQPERLVYLGKNWSGNGYWHQFRKIGDDRPVWCEVLDDQISSFEATPPAPATVQAEAPRGWATGLGLAVIGRNHFGNPIPQEWYAAARELLEKVATPPAPCGAVEREITDAMILAAWKAQLPSRVRPIEAHEASEIKDMLRAALATQPQEVQKPVEGAE